MERDNEALELQSCGQAAGATSRAELPKSQTVPLKSSRSVCERGSGPVRSHWNVCHCRRCCMGEFGGWRGSGLSLVCPVKKFRTMSCIPRILSVRLKTSAGLSLRKRKRCHSQIGRMRCCVPPVPIRTTETERDRRINIWVVLGTETLNKFLPHHKKPWARLAAAPYHQQSPQKPLTNPLWRILTSSLLSLNHLGSVDSIKSSRIRAVRRRVKHTCNKQVLK